MASLQPSNQFSPTIIKECLQIFGAMPFWALQDSSYKFLRWSVKMSGDVVAYQLRRGVNHAMAGNKYLASTRFRIELAKFAYEYSTVANQWQGVSSKRQKLTIKLLRDRAGLERHVATEPTDRSKAMRIV
ncbi:MAG: hypothetical protein QNJ06_07765 [Kiloniellales bacterium]|nr:hypothetical protein [Kiloniellales bacterium]